MIEPLAELVRRSRATIVLTGAGLSTGSGIPDFRSPGGIWEEFDPATVANIDAFRRDPRPVWAFYARRIALLRAARPNAAHRALAALEHGGFVRRVITQNVDGLHAVAGSDAIEVHGRIDEAVCLACAAIVAPRDLDALLAGAGDGVPRCACGAPLKPGVVMFGEFLPEDALQAAEALAATADLLIASGTTLEVYPVAALPELTHAAGGRVAIVNRGPTAYDALADLVLDGDVVELLPALASAVGVEVGGC